MRRFRAALIAACLVVLAVDTSRLPGHTIRALWAVVYTVTAAAFIVWLVTLRHGALTVFYGLLTVASGVRAFMLAVVDHRWAGAALNIMLIVFLRSYVRARRYELL